MYTIEDEIKLYKELECKLYKDLEAGNKVLDKKLSLMKLSVILGNVFLSISLVSFVVDLAFGIDLIYNLTVPTNLFGLACAGLGFRFRNQYEDAYKPWSVTKDEYLDLCDNPPLSMMILRFVAEGGDTGRTQEEIYEAFPEAFTPFEPDKRIYKYYKASLSEES